jgi:hypothetical protein
VAVPVLKNLVVVGSVVVGSVVVGSVVVGSVVVGSVVVASVVAVVVVVQTPGTTMAPPPRCGAEKSYTKKLTQKVDPISFQSVLDAGPKEDQRKTKGWKTKGWKTKGWKTKGRPKEDQRMEDSPNNTATAHGTPPPTATLCHPPLLAPAATAAAAVALRPTSAATGGQSPKSCGQSLKINNIEKSVSLDHTRPCIHT